MSLNNWLLMLTDNKSSSLSSVHPMTADIWSRTEATLILLLGPRGRWWLDLTPSPFSSRKRLCCLWLECWEGRDFSQKIIFCPKPRFEPRNFHPMNYLLTRRPVNFISWNRSQMASLPGVSALFPATETVPVLCALFIAGPLISTALPKVKCAWLALDPAGQRVAFSPSSAGGFVWRESSYRLSDPMNVRIGGSREDLNVMAKKYHRLFLLHPRGYAKHTYIKHSGQNNSVHFATRFVGNK